MGGCFVDEFVTYKLYLYIRTNQTRSLPVRFHFVDRKAANTYKYKPIYMVRCVGMAAMFG